MNTVLIIGATSGLGEAFTRRFHALGKKIIITGRRQDRLAALQEELSGLETRQIDVTDFQSLPFKVAEITNSFPAIDTVFLNAGIMQSISFADPSTSSSDSIAAEITTNLTAPIILTRLFLPHLLALKRPASILFTSSGLGFIPLGIYPVYCPTKAGIHSFCVALRQQLKPSPANNVLVVEIVPPYVDTELDAGFRERVNEMLGDSAQTPMPLQEYMDVTMKTLEGAEAKDLKEVAVALLRALERVFSGFQSAIEQGGQMTGEPGSTAPEIVSGEIVQ